METSPVFVVYVKLESDVELNSAKYRKFVPKSLEDQLLTFGRANNCVQAADKALFILNSAWTTATKGQYKGVWSKFEMFLNTHEISLATFPSHGISDADLALTCFLASNYPKNVGTMKSKKSALLSMSLNAGFPFIYKPELFPLTERLFKGWKKLKPKNLYIKECLNLYDCEFSNIVSVLSNTDVRYR